MRVLNIIASCAAACGIAGAPAVAADIRTAVPVENGAGIASSASYDWSGFYAGVNVGFTTGSFTSGSQAVNFGTPTSFDSLGGVVGGVQFGLNTQSEVVVLGAEADIQLAGVGQSDADDSVDLDVFGTLRGRVGVPMDNMLPYLTAGVAVGQGSAAEGGSSDSNTHIGWSAGLGTEFAFDENTSFRVEYIYTDLGERTYDLNNPVDAGFQFHSLRAGMNFSF